MSRRILLVVHNTLIALYVEEILLTAGQAVIGPAHDLSTAISLAKSESIDAAIVDIDIDGDAAWPITEILSKRDIPFILIDGFDNNVKKPIYCNRAPVLSKPLCPNKLICNLHRSAQQNRLSKN